MDNVRILSNHEYESLSDDKKREYLNTLRKHIKDQKNKSISIGHEMIVKFYPYLRNYTLEIRGQENIPTDDSAIIMCNHSNSHDYFTAHETFATLGKAISVFAAKDGISPLVKSIFAISDATLIDRNDKVSAEQGTIDFAKKIIEGKCGVIFGEATWNLHPIKAMQPLKIGGIRVGAITEKNIIPTIFEYVENPYLVDKEKDLYSKCIIVFGNPYKINPTESFIKQTLEIQGIMENMRKEIWMELGINRNTLSDIDPELYVNHTYMKKYKAFGYLYNSEEESKFFYHNNDGLIENEYFITETGEFKPGYIAKK